MCQERQVIILPTGIMVHPPLASAFREHSRVATGRFLPKHEFLADLTLQMAKIKDQPRPKDVVVIDCRGDKAGVPPPGERHAGHVGTHPGILKQVLSHGPTVAEVVAQLKEQRQSFAGDRGTCYLVTFCKAGKHRAVAWAHMFQALLQAHGFPVTMHLGATDWRGTCGGSYNCTECRVPWPVATLNEVIMTLCRAG